MLKVLIVDNSLLQTGAFKSIYSVVTELTPKVKSIFILHSKNLIKMLRAEGNKAYYLPLTEIRKSWRILYYLPFLIYNTVRLNKIIKRNKIEILHINDIYNMLGIMVKILNPKIKLVYHIRLLPNSYAGKMYSIWSRLIEKYCDQIICVSVVVAKNFTTKATVIYDALPFPEDHKAKPFPKNDINFLYLANYTKGKGQEYAIEAFQKIAYELPKAKLRFYGDTFNLKRNMHFKQELINLATKFNLQNKIVFNDFLQNPEEEIVKSDIMLNFSESESFSMTTLESLVYGTPVIVTNCGGPGEIIEDEISGILVPVGDINTMSKQMMRLAKDSELRAQFRNNGIKRVKTKFMIKDQASKLSALYNGLLNQQNGY